MNVKIVEFSRVFACFQGLAPNKPEPNYKGPLAPSNLFVDLDWQIVGIAHEEESSAGIFVNPQLFMSDTLGVEFGDHAVDVVGLERDVPQAGCFWIRRARRRRGKRKQLNYIFVAYSKVGLVRLPLFAIMLCYYANPRTEA